jgi:hypothetical protein
VKSLAKKLAKLSGFEIRRSSNVQIATPVPFVGYGPTKLCEVVHDALIYCDSLRVTKHSQLVGYKFARSCREASLYGTVGVLLLKHLAGVPKDQVEDELMCIKRSQIVNGLFYDKCIATTMAETEDWWGWRHLSMLCLMALGLYGVVPKYPVDAIDEVSTLDALRNDIANCDWGERVAYTSNRLQNLGVMLQFARDFQNSRKAERLVELLIDQISRQVNTQTGLFGRMPCKSGQQLSEHIQAAYHFWLIYDYDKIDIPAYEKAVEFILKTQNVFGGFGMCWNSSCCEDIDSIDPLYRWTRNVGQHPRITEALRLGVVSVLHSRNSDGGFVFRRGEAMRYGDAPATWAIRDESTSFFTWFRLLSLAYATTATGRDLDSSVLKREWTWGRAPGLQFL